MCTCFYARFVCTQCLYMRPGPGVTRSSVSVGGAYMNINDFPDMRVEQRISVYAPCISAGLMEYLK